MRPFRYGGGTRAGTTRTGESLSGPVGPSSVPVGEKLELLRCVAAEMKKNPRVFGSNAALTFRCEDEDFAPSDGSSIEQWVIETYSNAGVNAFDRASGLSRARSYARRRSVGWAYAPKMNVLENAQQVRDEVLEDLPAPLVRRGIKTLILLTSHLYLTF